jgi:hypothetical protein
VYRYYPTREQLLEAAGRWIGDELLQHPYPQTLDEVAELFRVGCRDFDEHPGLVRALALSQLGQNVRGYRRRERLQAISRALRSELDLPEDELRRAEAVFEGSYEFTLERDRQLETIVADAGSAVAVPSNIAHTFKSASGASARLLFVHQPAALEELFEEFDVLVDRAGETPADCNRPTSAR